MDSLFCAGLHELCGCWVCVLFVKKNEREVCPFMTLASTLIFLLSNLSHEREMCVCSSISLTLLALELSTWNVCVSRVFWTLFLFLFFLSPSSIILHTYTRLFL